MFLDTGKIWLHLYIHQSAACGARRSWSQVHA